MNTVMKQPIFRNKQAFEIEVPTPAGGSRIIPAGKYIMGNYFYPYFKQTKNLEIMPAEFDPDPKDVVMSYSNSQVAFEMYESFKKGLPTDIQTALENKISENTESSKSETPVAQEVAKENKKGKGRPKGTAFEEANRVIVGELGKIIPTPQEVDKMSLEEVTKLANKFGIDPSSFGHEELVKIMREKVKD